MMQQEPSLIIKQVDRSCNPFFFVLLDALIQLKTKSSRAHTFHTALCVYSAALSEPIISYKCCERARASLSAFLISAAASITIRAVRWTALNKRICRPVSFSSKSLRTRQKRAERADFIPEQSPSPERVTFEIKRDQN